MNTQDWSPLGWTGWISLQSKGLKSLLQYHSSKTWILQHSAFFTVQLSHPYMTTGRTIALIRWTFVGKVMSLLLNVLSMLVITFFPRSKCHLISWLLSSSGYTSLLVITGALRKLVHGIHIPEGWELDVRINLHWLPTTCTVTIPKNLCIIPFNYLKPLTFIRGSGK